MSLKKVVLGKSLIRDHRKKRNLVNREGFRHTCDLPDGYDWARLNLRSVTEQSSVDDFVDKVKLAENEYSKAFSNLKILTQDEALGALTEQEKYRITHTQEENEHLLCIPRRPSWDSSTTKEELDAKEREGFLNWRRNLALLKEEKQLQTTPYEKNLEVWRQLWRVIERSDVIVQIIDARNPLLFRCEDLEEYVKEVDAQKQNVLLLNKADFLSLRQRELWAEYFKKIGVKVIFFSALQSMEKEDKEDGGKEDDEDNFLDETTSEESDSEEPSEKDSVPSPSKPEGNPVPPSEKTASTDSSASSNQDGSAVELQNDNLTNSSKILSKSELVSFFKLFGSSNDQDRKVATVGLVGYPNVGKSSTINAILLNKKVQVSATPGKTKHFQTIMVEPDLCLCDCPGLVFPKFVCTKADMIINGILPIDQLTNHLEPVTLITQLIPRNVLESTYSIIIPAPGEGRDPRSPPTAEEFLNAYGYMRGFMTQRGLPDTARSSRYILKDFVNGKLLYCNPPPGVDAREYQELSDRQVPDHPTRAFVLTNVMKPSVEGDVIDKQFFSKNYGKAHSKGKIGISYLSTGSTSSQSSQVDKPWKRHHNRNKKEKLKRVYSASNQ